MALLALAHLSWRAASGSGLAARRCSIWR